MAQPVSHSLAASSTKLTDAQFTAVLRSFTSDLTANPLPPVGLMSREERLIAVVEVLLHGTGAELSRTELDYLIHLDVPRSIVAGDTRER